MAQARGAALYITGPEVVFATPNRSLRSRLSNVSEPRPEEAVLPSMQNIHMRLIGASHKSKEHRRRSAGRLLQLLPGQDREVSVYRRSPLWLGPLHECLSRHR